MLRTLRMSTNELIKINAFAAPARIEFRPTGRVIRVRNWDKSPAQYQRERWRPRPVLAKRPLDPSDLWIACFPRPPWPNEALALFLTRLPFFFLSRAALSPDAGRARREYSSRFQCQNECLSAGLQRNQIRAS